VILAFKKHIEDNFSFLLDSKLLIALSGGLDSVVLTHLFYQMDMSMALAHVNFNLRAEESDLDQKFVEDLGEKLQIPVFMYQADTVKYAEKHKLSIQMAARYIRYNWFDELLQKEGFDYVLTAHHLDDVIETFFINLSRGTGMDGLTGIPPINGAVVRPLLPFDRMTLANYAQQQGLSWREDSSNVSTKYVRNKMRHQLIPVLEAINPAFRSTFSITQGHLKEAKTLIDDYIQFIKPKLLKSSGDVWTLDLEKLKNVPHHKAVLYELLKDYGFTQWNDIYQLPQAQTGKMIYSNTHFLLKDRVYIKLGVIDKDNRANVKQEVASGFQILGKNYRLESYPNDGKFMTKSSEEVYIDKLKLKFPISVRKWKKGDYFYPLGMQGKMKISDFLINQKISRIEKEKIYLLCDAQDRIIWVIGQRLDNRFKITNNTKEILKITSNDTKDS